MPTEGQSPLMQKKAESVHVETDKKSIGLSIQNDAKSAVRVETGRRAALLLLETTQTGLPALKSTENR